MEWIDFLRNDKLSTWKKWVIKKVNNRIDDEGHPLDETILKDFLSKWMWYIDVVRQVEKIIKNC